MKVGRNVIIACSNSDKKAQKKLFYSCKPTFMAIAMRYVNDPDTAKDVVQESFIKIFDNLNDLKNPEAFEAWSRRIVINTALNKYHANRRLKEYEIPTNGREFHGVNLQPQIINQLDAAYLLELIDTMPEGYKLVFNLYLIDGFSHKEIAEILGIAESTSRSQLTKGKKFLQKKLQELNIQFS